MKKSTKKALLVVGGLGILGTIVYFIARPKSLPPSTTSTGGNMASGAASGSVKVT